MTQFSVRDAESSLDRLIADSLAGKEVIIARDGIPLVRLVPVAPRGKRRFGVLKGQIAMDARFDEPLPASELDGWNLA